MISYLFQKVSRLSVIKITIKTYMDTYIFLHYPGEVIIARHKNISAFGRVNFMCVEIEVRLFRE